MKKLNLLVKQHEEAIIPQDLDAFFDELIKQGTTQRKKKCVKKLVLYSTMSLFVVYLLILNTVPAFANAMNQIPVISDINRIFSYKSYLKEDKTYLLDVSYPKIVIDQQPAMEKKLNEMINTTIDQEVARIEQQEQEVKKTYEEAGIPYQQRHIIIDYEITCSNDHYLSFFLQLIEKNNNDYIETFHYNLDLESGSQLTLQDFYGEDYQRIINEDLIKQMKERKEQDPSLDYFIDGFGGEAHEFKGIIDTQSFFLDEDNKVNILFQSYEIAPGSMGQQIFTIDIPFQKDTQS